MNTNNTKRRPFVRAVLVLIGLVLIGQGIVSVVGGDLNYRNYWGGPVFAPLGILIGAFFIYVVLFRWEQMSKGSSVKQDKSDFRKRGNQ